MANSIIIDPGGHWAGVIREGEALMIVDSKGGQGIDFLCYNADQPEERYHATNTLIAALALRLMTSNHREN